MEVALHLEVIVLVAVFAMAFLASLAPTGPVAALVLQRSAAGDHGPAVALGVGGAIAEAGWAALAALGVSALLDAAPAVASTARGVGIAALLVVGARLVRHQPPARRIVVVEPAAHRLGRSALAGFGVSAANPVLLFTWAASLTLVQSMVGADLQAPGRLLVPLAVALGVAGAAVTSATLVRRYRTQMTERMTTGLIRVAGGLLLLVGVSGAVCGWRALVSQGS